MRDDGGGRGPRWRVPSSSDRRSTLIKSREGARGDALEVDKDCTFHPDTGNAERVLANSSAWSGPRETLKERIARLAFLEKQQKEAKQALAEENYHKQFTFKPKLSATAKTKKPTPLNDLVTNPKGVQVRGGRGGCEEAFVSEAPSSPTWGPSTRTRAPRPFQVDYSKQGGITARIREYRREKEICLQEARNEKEFKELEEAHSQPNAGVKKSKPKPTKGVTEVVPGLRQTPGAGRRAKQMEEEARARAAKVFLEDAAKKDVTHRRRCREAPTSAPTERLAPRRRRGDGDCWRRRRRGRRPTARSGPRPTSDRARNSLRGCSRRRTTTWRSTGLPLSAAYTAA